MQEFFGIDVGGTAVKWAVLGEDFSIRERGSLPTGFTTAEETVSALIGLVEPYRERVSAVGVSAPGGTTPKRVPRRAPAAYSPSAQHLPSLLTATGTPSASRMSFPSGQPSINVSAPPRWIVPVTSPS